MMEMDLSPTAPRGAGGRPRLRMPASRGGLAWLAVLVILGLFLAVQFGRQIHANWETGQRAAEIRAETEALAAENALLQQELEYLRSNAYVSAEARRLQNIGAPGEQVLIIPPGAEAPLPPDLATVSSPEPYLAQWVMLFFGSVD